MARIHLLWMILLTKAMQVVNIKQRIDGYKIMVENLMAKNY
jgi:hypothetical protein